MLSSFFNPKSIAVVGVSEDPKKLGSLIFHNVINAKFKGNLYPINSRIGGKILYGYQSYKSIKEIKEPIDLAIFVIAAKFCSATVDDCINNGTKNIKSLFLSKIIIELINGFEETDDQKKIIKEIQDANRQIIEKNIANLNEILTNVIILIYISLNFII